MKKSCMYAWIALTLVAGAAFVACGGGSDNKGAAPSTGATDTPKAAATKAATPTPTSTTRQCSTAGPVGGALTPRPVAFTFQDGACAAGSGEHQIGPFTVASAWRATLKLDGPECQSVGVVFIASDAASGKENVYADSAKGGAAMQDFPERMDPATPALWTLTVNPNFSDCPWTVTFSSIP